LVTGGGKWQKLILAGLAVLLAATLLNTLYFKGEGEKAGNGKGKKEFNIGTLPPVNIPVVNLELLENLNVPVKVTRNIFDPVYRPPVIKPVITPVPATSPPGAGRPNQNYVRPPTPPTREELEAKKAAADIGKFRFVGFIMRKGKLDIFLAKDSDYKRQGSGSIVKSRLRGRGRRRHHGRQRTVCWSWGDRRLRRKGFGRRSRRNRRFANRPAAAHRT